MEFEYHFWRFWRPIQRMLDIIFQDFGEHFGEFWKAFWAILEIILANFGHHFGGCRPHFGTSRSPFGDVFCVLKSETRNPRNGPKKIGLLSWTVSWISRLRIRAQKIRKTRCQNSHRAPQERRPPAFVQLDSADKKRSAKPPV